MSAMLIKEMLSVYILNFWLHTLICTCNDLSTNTWQIQSKWINIILACVIGLKFT